MARCLNRLLKLLISAGFFVCVSVANVIRRVRKRPVPATCVVFHYHSVPTKDRARFADQMDALLRWTAPVAANYCNRLEPNKRYAAVTFDDGFQSVFENAVPELIRRRIPATIFVVASLLGAVPRWKTFDGDDLSSERVIPADQLQTPLHDLITIGSHSMSHPWLPSLQEAEARIELSASRAKLNTLLQKDVTLFSFPYGALNDDLVAWCRDAGYERVFTISPKLAFSEPGEFVTGRILTDPTDWLLEFRLKLLGAYNWVPWAITVKTRLLQTLGTRRLSSNGIH